MAFSFANLGFWKLILVSAVLNIVQLGLKLYHPNWRRTGGNVRPAGVTYLMCAELLLLGLALSAGIGLIERTLRGSNRSAGRVFRIVAAMTGAAAFCFLAFWS